MFVRCAIVACAIVFSVLLSVPASAKNRLHDHDALRAVCGAEIHSQCGGIPEARGQLLACISPACRQDAKELYGVQWTDLGKPSRRTKMFSVTATSTLDNGAKKLSPVVATWSRVF
jgi:hypothetical protein